MSVVEAVEPQAIEATMTWHDPRILRRYIAETGADQETAEAHFHAFKQFLIVCADTDEPRAPSYVVDEMWHVALLFSRTYRAVCERLGRFVHHEPLEAPVDEALYALTREAVAARFGELDERCWPRPDAAPRCGSMYVP